MVLECHGHRGGSYWFSVDTMKSSLKNYKCNGFFLMETAYGVITILPGHSYRGRVFPA